MEKYIYLYVLCSHFFLERLSVRLTSKKLDVLYRPGPSGQTLYWVRLVILLKAQNAFTFVLLRTYITFAWFACLPACRRVCLRVCVRCITKCQVFFSLWVYDGTIMILIRAFNKHRPLTNKDNCSVGFWIKYAFPSPFVLSSLSFNRFLVSPCCTLSAFPQLGKWLGPKRTYPIPVARNSNDFLVNSDPSLTFDLIAPGIFY